MTETFTDDVLLYLQVLINEVGTINTNVSVKARSGSGQVRGTENEGFDYAAMGAAVIDAIARSGLKVECDDREFGRLITELQQV